MNHHFLTVKAALTACFTAVSAALGWKGIMAVVWVLAMALDYLSGTCAACRLGQWDSSTARQGLWHKGGMILVVTAAAIADTAMTLISGSLELGLRWPGLILPLVLAWYIITELGSILENAVKLGAAVPGWLTKLLKISLKAIEEQAPKE